MGTVAIQTQCCLKQDESDLDDDNGSQQSSTAIQLVEPVRWHAGGGLAGAPSRAPATGPRRSDSETTLVPG